MGAIHQWVKRLPRAGETCVFSQSEIFWRRDALMFDRVYAPLVGDPVFGNIDRLMPPEIPYEVGFSSLEIDREISRAQGVIGHWIEAGIPPDDFDYEKAALQAQVRAEQQLEETYRFKGVMGTWCLSDNGLFLERFNDGQQTAYQGALNNIPIVSHDISWDEVTAFREDVNAVRKYRDLRLWLADSLHAESEQHATDLIGQKIEDYRWSIKKHGLNTVVGALSNLWDWKQSLALPVSVGVAATFGGAVIPALMAGIAITSGIGAYFLKQKISQIDVVRGENREVAILVDMQDRFGNSTTH